ncbi:MAG: hypothetical protein V4636_07040 [Pseudomonadota bacterium]
MAVLAVAGAAFMGALSSAHALTNPPIRVADGVEYMCGGASKPEMAFMDMVAPRWAAVLEFAVSRSDRGAFPAQVQVSVRDKYTGRQVMRTTADGPFMVARLDPGTYDIEATVSGLTLTQSLTVFDGSSSKTVFQWPSNFDFVAAAAADSGTMLAGRAKAGAGQQAKAADAIPTRSRQAAASLSD